MRDVAAYWDDVFRHQAVDGVVTIHRKRHDDDEFFIKRAMLAHGYDLCEKSEDWVRYFKGRVKVVSHA